MPRGISDAEVRRIVRALVRVQRELEKYADQLEGEFESAMRAAQAKTYGRIATLIEDAPDFKALTMDERLRWHVQHKAAIEDAIDRAGYQVGVDKYLAGLPKFAQFVEASSVAGGMRFIDFPQSTIDYLRKEPFQRFVGIAGRSEDRLHSILYNEILGGPAKSDALETFRGAITGRYKWGNSWGFYEWHATTYARTAHVKFSQDLANNQYEKQGIQDGFLYLGPLDSKTRQFCIDHAGRVYTRAQIDAMRNGQNPEVADVWSNRGGYNCRHRWVAVTPGVAKALEQPAGQKILQEEQGADPELPAGVQRFNDANPAGWKPARSIAGAERWAREADLADTVRYEGLELRHANEINRTMGILLREFPDARSKMKFLGSSDGFRSTFGISPDPSALAAHYPDRGLEFNVAWFGKSPKVDLDEAVAHAVKTGFMTPDRSAVENIIAHEAGHLLDWAKQMRHDPAFTQLVAKLRDQGLSIEKDLSQYAASLWVEVFSESFKEYILAPSPRPFATAFGRLMLEKYGVAK